MTLAFPAADNARLRFNRGRDKLSQAVRELLTAVSWGCHTYALAKASYSASGLYCLHVADHFADVGKMVDLGSGSPGEADDIIRRTEWHSVPR